MIQDKKPLPRGTRYKLVEMTGLSLNVIDNHIYNKFHNEAVERAILKLMKSKRKLTQKALAR